MDGDEFVKLTCFEGQRTSQTLEGVYICHLCVGEEWKGSQEEEDKGGIAGKKSSCGEGASEDRILFVMDGSSWEEKRKKKKRGGGMRGCISHGGLEHKQFLLGIQF